MTDAADLAKLDLPADTVGLIEGLTTTRAIRRYRDEPVPPEALRAMLFAATRAPSGSNRQPFRFIVLTDGPKAKAAKGSSPRAPSGPGAHKRDNDGYDKGSGAVADSPKARMAATMQRYTDEFASVPVLVLPCLVRYRDPNSFEGASIFPACQNLLLAARALGYGGVLTGWHGTVETELRRAARHPRRGVHGRHHHDRQTRGSHGPVRRRPISELVYAEGWGDTPAWAVDPPGTAHTSAGPPKGTTPLSVPPPAG